MANRSASASIKGYMYQFIHTIKDILDNEDYIVNIIEGIEDLDILNGNEIILVQYKYHELQNFTNSRVAKPIGLMFNNFIDKKENYKYRLAIFMDDELPEIDISRLKDILALKSAQDYISHENIKYCSDNDEIKKFLRVFEWEKTERYIDVESKIIKQLVNAFKISKEEAETVYLPNAIKKIIDLGIQNDEENRRIKTSDFKSFLNSKKAVSDISFMSRLHGESQAIKLILQRMKQDGCKKNNMDIVISFDDGTRYQLEELIINIAKVYFYRGNKSDYRPVTFIVNESSKVKKKIAEIICNSNETIIFNDGYEDNYFCKEVFNIKPITTNTPQRGKVNDVNYNFKILSKDTFLDNKEGIKFNNGILITVGKANENIVRKFHRIYHLGNLENCSIMDIIGGCNG